MSTFDFWHTKVIWILSPCSKNFSPAADDVTDTGQNGCVQWASSVCSETYLFEPDAHEEEGIQASPPATDSTDVSRIDNTDW